MNTKEAINDLLINILSEDLEVATREELDPDTNLISEGYLDSINVMRLIAQIEKSLSYKIPPRDLVPKNFTTIEVLANYLFANANPTHENKAH